MIKEIPILFSTPMVQAILEGRKTQTRRIVKPQPESPRFGIYEPTDCISIVGNNKSQMPGYAKFCWRTERHYPKIYQDGSIWSHKCPYGQPGYVLWVRETFRTYYQVGKDGYTLFDNEILEYAADNPPLLYLMDGDGAHMYNKDGSEKYVPWHPSIHMPKSAARIWLQVTDVRVERLQDITEDGAVAEGVQPNCAGVEKCPSQYCQRMGCQSTGEYYHYQRDLDDFPAFSAIESFESLWQSINGPKSWNANPWVWVVSFAVLSTTGKPN